MGVRLLEEETSDEIKPHRDYYKKSWESFEKSVSSNGGSPLARKENSKSKYGGIPLVQQEIQKGEEDQQLSIDSKKESTSNKEMNILMIGNSYTYWYNTEIMIQKMLEEDDATISVRCESIAKGGYWLEDHLDEGIPELADRDWDYVVLQDHSLIPGLYDTNTSYREDSYYCSDVFNCSMTTISAMSERISNSTSNFGVHKPKIILFETWGRQNGYSGPEFGGGLGESGLYKDFKTMQDRLTEGYNRYQQIESDTTIEVAPVGQAFRASYNSDENTFNSLYWFFDDSHPSRVGSYLSACVIYAKITNKSPVGQNYKPYGVNYSDRDLMQQIAESTVFRLSAMTSPSENYDKEKSNKVEPYRDYYLSNETHH